MSTINNIYVVKKIDINTHFLKIKINTLSVTSRINFFYSVNHQSPKLNHVFINNILILNYSLDYT